MTFFKLLNRSQNHILCLCLCKHKPLRAGVKHSKQKHTSGSIPHAWNSFACSVQITSGAPMVPLQEGRKTMRLRTVLCQFIKWSTGRTLNWTQGQVQFRSRFSEQLDVPSYCFSNHCNPLISSENQGNGSPRHNGTLMRFLLYHLLWSTKQFCSTAQRTKSSEYYSRPAFQHKEDYPMSQKSWQSDIFSFIHTLKFS